MDDLRFDGYIFSSQGDLEQAKKERKKIEYIESHLEGSNSNKENLLLVYTKAVDTKSFQTPVGLGYMNTLRNRLIDMGVSKLDIPDIPLYSSFTHNSSEDIRVHNRIATKPSKTKAESKLDKYKANLTGSIIINIIMALLVAAMFYITLNSSQPNILNYKNAIINEYAGWEEELTQKDLELREKERALSEKENGFGEIIND